MGSFPLKRVLLTEVESVYRTLGLYKWPFSVIGLSDPRSIEIPPKRKHKRGCWCSWKCYMKSIDAAYQRIPLSHDGLPKCVVREDVLELFIDHFSWGWLTTIINRRHVRGKRFGCFPSMPVSLPPEKTPILHVNIYMVSRLGTSPYEVSKILTLYYLYLSLSLNDGNNLIAQRWINPISILI